MTRTEYMAQLEKHLKKLPHKEFQEAITFFTEYFDEAGPEKEAIIMEELGTPKEAASDLINNILQRHIESDDKDAPTGATSSLFNRRLVLKLTAFVLYFLFSLFLYLIEPLLGLFALLLLTIFSAFYLGKHWQEVNTTKKTIWLAVLAILSLPVAVPILLGFMLLLFLLIFMVLGLLILGLVASMASLIGGIYFVWEACTLFLKGWNVFLLGIGSGLSFIGGAILLFLMTGFFAYWSWKLIKASFTWILSRGKRA